MPPNRTLEGVPDGLYERMKESAVAYPRSLDSEIIARLPAQVLPRRAGAEEPLIAVRAVSGRLAEANFDRREIDRFKREGRT